MTDITKILFERRSVRRYERRPIETEKLDFIYRAIQNTSTSYNGQQFSVIAVTDQALKEELYEIIGQKQVKTSAVFFVFCTDFHQLRIAGQAKGIDYPDFEEKIDGFTVGVIDAAMAMQNAMVACEALELGCCAIGYVRTADPKRVSQILGLPEGVAIVCGLSVGYPNEEPDLKPKRPVSLVVHENHYRPQGELVPELLEYDAAIEQFNEIRSGTTTDNDWVGHILDYHHEAKKHDLTGYLNSQGFLERTSSKSK